MNKTTNTAARLADIIARATGATIDPVLACPKVRDGVLEFCAAPDEATLIAHAMDSVHGVTEVGCELINVDPDDIYVVVSISLEALTSRLASLEAA